jgi:hypothetical protein
VRDFGLRCRDAERALGITTTDGSEIIALPTTSGIGGSNGSPQFTQASAPGMRTAKSGRN